LAATVFNVLGESTKVLGESTKVLGAPTNVLRILQSA
jgi:hypothetical protein